MACYGVWSIPNQEQFCPLGDIRQCLETFLVILWLGVLLASGDWRPECCQPPYKAQDSPHHTEASSLQ